MNGEDDDGGTSEFEDRMAAAGLTAVRKKPA
jgi:hypothetical protein